MAQAIDLTNCGDEFTFHFGGEGHRIDAETFSKSMLEFSTALKEINRIVNPQFEIRVYIDAVNEGSFRTRIKLLGKKVGSASETILIHVIIPIFVMHFYYIVLGEKCEMTTTVINNIHIVQIGDQHLSIPKEVAELPESISKNPEIEGHIRNAFRILKADREITDFGIGTNLKEEGLLVEIPHKEFDHLSGIRDSIVSEGGRHRVTEERTKLLIIRAIFERSSKKWQFVWGDGSKISAAVLDKSFYDKIVTREYVIGAGDTLGVVLRTRQHRDEVSGTWVNTNHEVIKVLYHLPGSH